MPTAARAHTTAAAPAHSGPAAVAMRRVGMFGGTFDPVHAAHLRMAEAFFTQCQLDQLRLIPAGNPYHRDNGPQASAEQRLAMVQLAIADRSGWLADDREVRRARPAYTVETLEELRAELGPDCQLWLLIGGDSLHNLPRWTSCTWPISPWRYGRVSMRPTCLPYCCPTGSKYLIFQTARLPVQSAP